MREAAADIVAAGVADVGAQRAGRGLAGTDRGRLGDQIDDPARALGAVGGGRIGQDFDTGILGGRNLLQQLAPAGSVELAGGPAVDQDGDIGIAAQADIAVGIDLDRGNVAQGLGQGAGLGLEIVGEAVAGAFAGGADVIGAGGDDHFVERRGLGGLFSTLGRSLFLRRGGGRRCRRRGLALGRRGGLGEGGTRRGRKGRADEQQETDGSHGVRPLRVIGRQPVKFPFHIDRGEPERVTSSSLCRRQNRPPFRRRARGVRRWSRRVSGLPAGRGIGRRRTFMTPGAPV